MKTTFLLLLVLVFTSCSNLRVQVSTANPDKLKEIYKNIDPYEKLAFRLKLAASTLLSSDIIVKRGEIVTEVNNAIHASTTTGVLDAESEEVVKENFNRNYTTAVNTILSNNNTANTHLIRKEYSQAVDVYLALLPLFETLILKVNNEEYLKTPLKQPIVNDATRNANFVNSVFYGGRANLLGDEMVSYITMKSNDKIWESTYNRTVSRTYFGNADIAVVLNEMPNNYNNNYSIKGVRVDAAKLIQASFDVVTQAINVAASFSGIQPANKGDANSFYPEEFDDIKNLQIKSSELANKKELLRQSQRQLLLKILGENINSKSGDDLKKSVDDIKVYWDANKTNLN